MNLKVSFSWIGLVVFALPMLINIVYAIFPPSGKAEQTAAVTHWIEMVEQISRMAYLLAITLLVSRNPVHFRSVWLCLAAIFLLLYYVVWIRYFAGGRDIALLNRPFFFVPMPLAVFPVLYFFVRCHLASQCSGHDRDGDFRRGTSDSVHPIVPLRIILLKEA